MRICGVRLSSFFFFNDTATTEIYTLSLHDALPIYGFDIGQAANGPQRPEHGLRRHRTHGHGFTPRPGDRKSTRLNSSHLVISYAVFCLKKKKRCSSCFHFNTHHHKDSTPSTAAFTR